jgi:hypothetical protein
MSRQPRSSWLDRLIKVQKKNNQRLSPEKSGLFLFYINIKLEIYAYKLYNKLNK